MTRWLRSIIELPPCGRGIPGPCLAVIKVTSTGETYLLCLKCGCVAPYRGGRDDA
jgi:hypothetical protein